MGLTIHYELSLDGKCTNGEVIDKLLTLNGRLKDLPFDKVGIVRGTVGERVGKIDTRRDYDESLYARFPRHTMIETEDGKEFLVNIDISEGFGFSVFPGKGSEWASFGLCKLPKTILFSEPISHYHSLLEKPKKPKRFNVENGGKWFWSSFCKTQYANMEGIEHFIRCHTLVISALDIAKSIGFSVKVIDEGEYWENRDTKKLAQEVNSWDEFIAGIVGKTKDSIGKEGQISAPILTYPNYEILEARGASRLDSIAVDKKLLLEGDRNV